MNGWTVAAFLVGWMIGTWMSWRKIFQERRQAQRTQAGLSAKIYEFLKDVDVINITVTDEGQNEISVDREKLDQLLGKDPTEH